MNLFCLFFRSTLYIPQGHCISLTVLMLIDFMKLTGIIILFGPDLSPLLFMLGMNRKCRNSIETEGKPPLLLELQNSEQLAQRDHGVSILEDIKNLTHHIPGQSALEDSTLSRRVGLDGLQLALRPPWIPANTPGYHTSLKWKVTWFESQGKIRNLIPNVPRVWIMSKLRTKKPGRNTWNNIACFSLALSSG